MARAPDARDPMQLHRLHWLKACPANSACMQILRKNFIVLFYFYITRADKRMFKATFHVHF